MEQKQELLQKLLNKIATEQNYENPEIVVNEISSGGANYTSKLFTAVIKAKSKEDLQLFAKIAAFGEEIRKDMPADLYDIERFAYTKLVKIYASLEEEHGVPEEHRLSFTKCYGVDASRNQDILVLENLLALGYGPHDRFHSYGWEYASSAITDLAKLHALSFAFSESNPEEYEKTCEVLKFNWVKNENMDIMVQKTVDLALDTVDIEHKEALSKFLEGKPNPFALTGPVRKSVIIHADYRGNNLLHRVREDGKLEFKILDLQTLQPGSPAADLIYFIITGSDEEFRAKYYQKLIDHYYSELSAALKRLNLDPEKTYSREDLEYELKEKMGYGLVVAVFLLPIVTVDSEDAPEINESTEVTAFAVNKTSDIYAERLKGFINDYVKWGILK